VVAALDGRRLRGVRVAAPASSIHRRILRWHHAGPRRLLPGPAGLQRAPLRRRPGTVPDHRAHRTGLPGAAGLRRRAAGAAARRAPEVALKRSAIANDCAEAFEETPARHRLTF